MKRCDVTVSLECFREAGLLHSILREALMVLRVRCRRERGRRRRVGTPSGALEREDVLGEEEDGCLLVAPLLCWLQYLPAADAPSPTMCGTWRLGRRGRIATA